MKKFLSATLAVAVLLSTACSKTESESALQQKNNQAPVPAKLILNVVGEGQQTKASGTGHGVQSDDNTVTKLEVFIFRNTGTSADNGQLEFYKKFTSSDLSGGMKGLEITATTGNKSVYVICNSHNDNNFSDVLTLDSFKTQLSLLKDENLKNFVMTGSSDVTLQTTTDLTVKVSRMVSRIKLASVKTAFAGTPLASCTLNNVKAYLINVHANKLLWNGSDATSPLMYNLKKYVSSDCSQLSMSGMLDESIADSVNDTGNSTARYFYAFENTIASENKSADDYFTRLVIEGEINGIRYYYPININRDNYGFVSGKGNKQGIERNKSYELSVVISKSGSLDPNEPIEFGTLSVTVSVDDWTLVPATTVNF